MKNHIGIPIRIDNTDDIIKPSRSLSPYAKEINNGIISATPNIVIRAPIILAIVLLFI